MTAVLPPDQDQDRPPAEPPDPSRRQRRLATVTALVATVAFGVAAVTLALVLRSEEPPAPAPAPTTTAAPTPAPSAGPAVTEAAPPATTAPSVQPPPKPTTSTEPESPLPVIPADAAPAVWPPAYSLVRYHSPAAAARGFAINMAVMSDPHTGRYRAADTRSGEIDVRPGDSQLATHVVVRKLSDGNWWVLGASTDDITLDSPAVGDVLAPPTVTLTGSALAFEGTVFVRVVDDQGAVVGSGTVVGGGDVRRPFTGTVGLTRANTDRGAVVLSTEDMREGLVTSAAVIRVAFSR
jgi:hypothetical protein